MGEYSGKRSFGGLLVPRKGPGLVSRDAAESGDKFCNRIGCNGRLNHTRSPHNGSEKFKSSRPSFHASNGKEIVGSSTRTCSAVANTRKSFLETRKKPSSLSELDLSETSSVEDEPEVLDVVSSSSGRAVQIGNQSDAKRSGKVSLIEAGSSSIAASNSRPRKAFWQKSGISNRDAPPLGPSVPLASTSPGARNRYGLGNLRCNSASDVVVPSGGSSSESKISRRNNILKNGNPKGESCSSVCGKKMTRPSSDGTTSTQGLSISDSRQTRNGSPSGNGGLGWGRTRKSINGTTRTRLSSQGNGNGLLPKDITPQVPQPELHIGGGIPGSSHQFSAEASSSSRSTSFSSSSSSGGSSPGLMRAGPAELGIPCSLMNHDGLRRYNMGGIAEVYSFQCNWQKFHMLLYLYTVQREVGAKENLWFVIFTTITVLWFSCDVQVLMALERIEQDEGLTHEVLVLGTEFKQIGYLLINVCQLSCRNYLLWRQIYSLVDLAYMISIGT